VTLVRDRACFQERVTLVRDRACFQERVTLVRDRACFQVTKVQKIWRGGLGREEAAARRAEVRRARDEALAEREGKLFRLFAVGDQALFVHVDWAAEAGLPRAEALRAVRGAPGCVAGVAVVTPPSHPPESACPISTGGRTRRVRLVRGEGRGVSDQYEGGGRGARADSALRE